jgi:formylglycine-generating enzyme required for sulfatase activity
VVNISWADAQDFVRWLSEQTGERYRLPTDAEWEYASRAGTSSRFWWGEQAGEGRANCAECGSLWDSEKTGPVGRFPPNPFGLHDTAGNAWEWVADCIRASFADAPPQGQAGDDPECGKRVIRGGAWSFPPREMRSANRWRDFPARSSDDTGLRLVRDLEPYP